MHSTRPSTHIALGVSSRHSERTRRATTPITTRAGFRRPTDKVTSVTARFTPAPESRLRVAARVILLAAIRNTQRQAGTQLASRARHLRRGIRGDPFVTILFRSTYRETFPHEERICRELFHHPFGAKIAWELETSWTRFWCSVRPRQLAVLSARFCNGSASFRFWPTTGTRLFKMSAR